MDPAGPEQAHAVAVQAVRAACVERLVDRLGRHPHLQPARKEGREQAADLLGTPAPFEVVGHDPAELEIPAELPPSRADPPPERPPVGLVRVIRRGLRVPVASDLPADRGGCSTELGRDRAEAHAPEQSVGDRDALGLRQEAGRHRMRRTHDRRIRPNLAGAGRDRPAVAPAVPDLPVHPDDAARRRVAHALPH